MSPVRQRSPWVNPNGVPLLPAPIATRGSENHAKQTAAVGQQPNPLNEREVEEAAMPGQEACAHALPTALWQLTLENCQLPPASPQSSFDRLESAHVFAEPTLRQNVALSNRKGVRLCAETVEDENSLWMDEEKYGRTLAVKMSRTDFQ